MSEEFWWVPGVGQKFDNVVAKSLLDVRQMAAGTMVVRVYALTMAFMQQEAPPTRLDSFIVARIASGNVNPTISPYPCKPSNTPLPSTINCGTNRPYAELGAPFRQFVRGIISLVTAVSNFQDTAVEWNFDVPMALVWGSYSRSDANVQPVVIRPGEGFHVRQTTATAGTVPTAEMDMLFGVNST